MFAQCFAKENMLIPHRCCSRYLKTRQCFPKEDAFEGTASEVIFFQNKPVLKEVMETVEAMANRIYELCPKRKPARKKQHKLIHASLPRRAQ